MLRNTLVTDKSLRVNIFHVSGSGEYFLFIYHPVYSQYKSQTTCDLGEAGLVRFPWMNQHVVQIKQGLELEYTLCILGEM